MTHRSLIQILGTYVNFFFKSSRSTDRQTPNVYSFLLRYSSHILNVLKQNITYYYIHFFLLCNFFLRPGLCPFFSSAPQLTIFGWNIKLNKFSGILPLPLLLNYFSFCLVVMRSINLAWMKNFCYIFKRFTHSSKFQRYIPSTVAVFLIRIIFTFFNDFQRNNLVYFLKKKKQSFFPPKTFLLRNWWVFVC